MKLPSSIRGVTTKTVGLFQCETERLARWLTAGPEGWAARPEKFDSLEDLCDRLTPGSQFRRQALVPWGDWTVMLTDGPLGSDVGMIPSLVARQLDRIGIRATAVDPGSARYDAVILEVFDPTATDHLLRLRREITAANDGGRWVFSQFGEPYPFEDLDAYGRRRIRDRFTQDMLHHYLEALGVPLGTDPDFGATVMIE